METRRCGRCGAEWVPRVEAPARCPRCGRFLTYNEASGMKA